MSLLQTFPGGKGGFVSTAGFTPVGTVISVMGKTAPQNYLSCDGTAYNILDYPELAAYFKEQFGSYNYFGGNGTTTFAVPDLRGEFLRGTGTNSHANQGSGADVGVHQDGTEQIFSYGASAQIYGAILPSEWGAFPKNSDYSYEEATNKLNAVTRSATSSSASAHFTSRPTNTSILFCIAYKNIFIDQKEVIDLTGRERIVGTVIEADGTVKDLWEKRIVTSDLPNNNSKTIPLDQSFTVRAFSAYANDSDGAVFQIANADLCKIDIILHTIKITSNFNMIAYGYSNITITIRYTKTES